MQFPSMASLQGALPNVSPASGVIRTSSFGTPSSAWMPPQASSYASALPPQAPSYASAMPPSMYYFFLKKIISLHAYAFSAPLLNIYT